MSLKNNITLEPPGIAHLLRKSCILDENSYERCGRDFINKAGGTFQSPSFPASYPKESHCTWNMTVKPGRYIKVTFEDVDIFGNLKLFME